MKKKALTTAVLAGIGGVAGLAGIANAVNINNDGLGQVLIYPYYTVNAGNQTLMSIVNTTNRVKAVKIRFLEGLNSRECLDFNLYLSPFDVWTSAIFALDDNGPANLVTRDTSTTVPDIIGQTPLAPNLPVLPSGDRYVPFRTFALDNAAWDPGDAHDDGPADPIRCREGHFEAIEMAELNDLVEGSASAATHVQSGSGAGFPADATQLNEAWRVDTLGAAVGYWAIDPLIDTDPPTGGLFGAASQVDGADGTQVSYDADAVAAFGPDILHSPPGSTQPTVASANFDPNVDGDVNSLVFDSDIGSVISSEWDGPSGGVDAVSAVFMRNQVYNEYALDSDLDASTEWVLTFPTKRFYTDPVFVGSTARAPFTEVFDYPDGACEEFGLRFWDREERTTTPGITPIDFSPPRPGIDPDRLFLCWETNAIRFTNEAGGLGGSGLFGIQELADGTRITFTLDGVFENGWARIDFTADSNDNPLSLPHQYTSFDGDIYNGLPVTGFAAQVIKNGTLNGGNTLANYAGLFRHKADKDIIGS